MKIFDYFKGRKSPQKNTKGDKVFIVILVIFGLIISVNFIAKSLGYNAAVFEFNIGIFDGIILGIIFLGYIISVIRKGRKND